MMTKSAAAILCAALVQVACTADAAQETSSVTTSDVDGVLHVRVASLAPRDVSQWTTSELFATSAPATRHELYQVTAARFLDGGILAVANSGTGEILALDTLGALRARMGGKGEGPGEFTWISGLDVDSAGNIIAYDPRQGRLTRLSPDGEVLETRAFAPPNRVVDLEPLAVLADGRVAAIYGEMRIFAAAGEKRDTTPLMLFDADGSSADTLGMWPATEWAFMSFSGGASRAQVGFGRTAPHAGRNQRFAIGSNDSIDVTVFDDGSRVAMRITGAPGATVSDSDVEVWRDELLASRTQSPEAVRRALDDVPHRSTYPGFEALVLDDDGRVWIGSYVRPTQTERDWLVIGADGRAHGRLTLPASARILDVADERIALLSRDELDEEYIRVMRIVAR